MIKNIISKLSKLCAYSHMFKVFISFLKKEDISQQTKAGRNIALIGLFCPFFWYALFTGASKGELTFHAIHSSIVFLIGIVVIFMGLKQQKEQ